MRYFSFSIVKRKQAFFFINKNNRKEAVLHTFSTKVLLSVQNTERSNNACTINNSKNYLVDEIKLYEPNPKKLSFFVLCSYLYIIFVNRL